MSLRKITTGLLFLTVGKLFLCASDSIYSELWVLDNLEIIGGHEVSVLGNPQVAETDLGNAIEFDGNADQLIINSNPIDTAKEFTVELIFKPFACYPDNIEPRFVHIQGTNDPQEKRVMMELRVNKNNECYLDGFMKTDTENLTLIDETLVHPTEVWHHAAITYKQGTFTTYFNGEKEVSGTVNYSKEIIKPEGKTSLGARMNNRAYYKGMMKVLKVTHTVLDPAGFMNPEDFMQNVTENSYQKSFADEIKTFPNPVDEELKIRLTDHIRGARISVKIINIEGKTIFSNVYSLEEFTGYLSISTSHYLEGTYFLQVKSHKFVENKVLLIRH